MAKKKPAKKAVAVHMPDTPLPPVKWRAPKPSDMKNPILDEAVEVLKKQKRPRVANSAPRKPSEVIARPAKVPAVKPEKKAPRPRKPKRPTWQTEFKCKTLGGLGGL